MHLFPQQGANEPWVNPQDYGRDKKMFRQATIDDGVLVFNQHPTQVKQNQAD